MTFTFSKQQLEGGQTYNNFNRIFSNTPAPLDPIIDLSSGCETEDNESPQNLQINRKRHHSAEVLNVPKRKAQEAVNIQQKTQHDSSNDALEILNLLNCDDSNYNNQAQNLVKVECPPTTDATSSCDSTNSLNQIVKHYHNLEPKDCDVMCDCLKCFPKLGSSSNINVSKSRKCKKQSKSEQPSEPSTSSSSSTVDLSMIPGPSGMQKRNINSSSTSTQKLSKDNNNKRTFYESSSDDSDSDAFMQRQRRFLRIQNSESHPPKNDVLKAPDLQFDWVSSDSSDSNDEDDVIFIADNANSAPIDLTGDSDEDSVAINPSIISKLSTEKNSQVTSKNLNPSAREFYPSLTLPVSCLRPLAP